VSVPDIAAHTHRLAMRTRERISTADAPTNRRKNQKYLGERPVALPREQQPPDTSTAHQASNDLVKLIRKLRWIGMDDQAEGLQKELEQRRATTADCVLATSGETD
jgi:hypothetical protein